MEEILLPSKIELTPGKDERHATLTVEPCWHGYGTTLGNALRRVMLSSLPGAAVTAVKIKGASHEFAGVPGVQEDVLELMLNLKMLRMRLFTDEPVRLTLKVKGEKEVTAADIEGMSDVEIVNPDLHLATLTDKKAELEMEIFVGRGRGYVPVEERSKEKPELGMIAVDAVYSPVREVGWKVENVRVGQITNFDKLIMDIETDGTITPQEALDQSLRIILDHFNLMLSRDAAPAEAPAMEAGETPAEEAPAMTEEAAPAAEETPAEEAAPEEGEKKAKKPKKAKK
ncbi:MAG TPA: DNA-directed RNA polymerase subunit alpha [Candidatus Binatia bacterium]|nr:DNA-directed RNA polymerase subunit alpha [Candidatus Binatia bacterium]